MPIDPAAKIAARERAALKRREKARNNNVAKRKPRQSAHLSQSEKIIVAELIDGTPKQIEAAAIVLQRPVEKIRTAVSRAKQKFQASAEKYVDIHSKVAEMALATGDYTEARKAAEFAMTNLSAKDAEGNVETIIDRDVAANSGPRIQIGIALGGLPPHTRTSSED